MSSVLTLWNDTAAKQAIIDYAAAVTTHGSPDFVLPANRIATFDNGSTLGLEKPMYIRLQHGLHAVGLMAVARPDVRDRQPFNAVYEKDSSWLLKVADDYTKGASAGVFTLAADIAEAHAGITVESLDADAREFLSTTQEGTSRYRNLRADGGAGSLSAGQRRHRASQLWGGRDFIRAVCEELYSIRRSRTNVRSIATRHAEGKHGVGHVLRADQIEQPINDGPGTSAHIHSDLVTLSSLN